MSDDAIFKNIPQFTVLRFARYLNFLVTLPDVVEEISSSEMAGIIGIKPTQLRQDFFTLGGFGRQGKKYNVRFLIQRLSEVLALQQPQDMVLAGAGHLGQAIANYQGFERFNLVLKGIFDVNPKLIGLKMRDIIVRDLDELTPFIQQHKIQIGIICTPHQAAQTVCDMMVEADVKAIWNFSPENVTVPDGIVVQNENLSVGIMNLSYRLNREMA
ncbi:MAG: redox-sensing transcriptional repressor Rex [bacterium]|jgi:redox-sensing transcriptional repressor|nr:redox-sensing transcriptional repressor Rex [bacterium]